MASFFLREPAYSEPNNASVLLTLENSATSRVLRQHDSLEASVGADELEGLNEYEIAAMQMSMARGRVTTKELGEHIDKGPTLCGRTLKGLAEGRGLLTWHGSTHDPRSTTHSQAASPAASELCARPPACGERTKTE